MSHPVAPVSSWYVQPCSSMPSTLHTFIHLYCPPRLLTWDLPPCYPMLPHFNSRCLLLFPFYNMSCPSMPSTLSSPSYCYMPVLSSHLKMLFHITTSNTHFPYTTPKTRNNLEEDMTIKHPKGSMVTSYTNGP